MKVTFPVLLITMALLAAVPIAKAQQATDPRVADLFRAGKIRVGLFLGQYSKDPATGQSRHDARLEIARALAARIGVEVALLEHPTPSEAIACLKAHACDLLFLPFDDRAATVGDFSPPIFQFDYTLLVPAESSIRSVADADRPGVRIAAVRRHASTVTLSRSLKHAELVYADTPQPAFDLLRSGQADAMASSHNGLLEFSGQWSGSRVLADRYGANINRMVVPKGKAGWLSYVSEFVEEAKASGLVRHAIDRAGPPGITVPPPGDPATQQ